MSAPKPSTFDPLALSYDLVMAPLERLGFARLRSRLLAHATGRILEIGIGTGASVPGYALNGCVVGIDESPVMLAAAAARASAMGRCVLLNHMNAEQLAFPDGIFDTVVASLVLCSVVDQRLALQELKRVLHTPGGRLLLLEHTRPDHPALGRVADLVNVPWVALNKRCNINRRTGKAVVDAGFVIERMETRIGGLVRLIVARVPG